MTVYQNCSNRSAPLKTRWLLELKIEKPLNDFFSRTSRWILKYSYRNVSWVTIYQNCSNLSTPLNKIATRAKNNKTFKQLLLQNRFTDFEIISQDGSWSDPLPKLLKPSAPLNKMATRAKNRKTFKHFLLLNQWIYFGIILHACSLGDPSPKLLKQFGSVEQDGHQS